MKQRVNENRRGLNNSFNKTKASGYVLKNNETTKTTKKGLNIQFRLEVLLGILSLIRTLKHGECFMKYSEPPLGDLMMRDASKL